MKAAPITDRKAERPKILAQQQQQQQKSAAATAAAARARETR
jgi:hypothetical protein